MTINKSIFTFYKQLTLRNECKHHLRNRNWLGHSVNQKADEILWDIIIMCSTDTFASALTALSVPSSTTEFLFWPFKIPVLFHSNPWKSSNCRPPADRAVAWINLLNIVKYADGAGMETIPVVERVYISIWKTFKVVTALHWSSCPYSYKDTSRTWR